MIQQLNNLILCSIIVVIFSCSNTTNNHLYSRDVSEGYSIEEESLFTEKISFFYGKYSRNDFLECYVQKKSYPIEDSLCFYLSKISPSYFASNKKLRISAGKVLEKIYLEAREKTLTPESFPIYNMSILVGNVNSNVYALNIIMEQKNNIDSSFLKYSNTWTDFICVDSVVLKLEKIEEFRNDSTHEICKYLVDNNKTGGCKW